MSDQVTNPFGAPHRSTPRGRRPYRRPVFTAIDTTTVPLPKARRFTPNSPHHTHLRAAAPAKGVRRRATAPETRQGTLSGICALTRPLIAYLGSLD